MHTDTQPNAYRTLCLSYILKQVWHKGLLNAKTRLVDSQLVAQYGHYSHGLANELLSSLLSSTLQTRGDLLKLAVDTRAAVDNSHETPLPSAETTPFMLRTATHSRGSLARFAQPLCAQLCCCSQIDVAPSLAS